MQPQLNVTVEGRVFENWGPKTISFRESRDIEIKYGKPFGTFQNDLDAGSMYARQVLGWILLKRDNKDCRLDDLIDLNIGDVVIDVVCSDCGGPLEPGRNEAGKTVLVHEDSGSEDCADSGSADDRPTQAEDPAPSAEVEPASESTSGSEGTSPTSPTSLESDPGNGTG
jgi:hypothetical protein